MKIFLTGGSGLVGRNICDRLTDKYTLVAPDITELDLCNYNNVLDFIASTKPDMVIHCAGLVGGIAANMANPVRFLVENMDMGRNVILASFNTGVERLINLGSSCMYPRNSKNILKEEYILTGELEPTNEGYALAKIITQRLCNYISMESPVFQYKTLVPCNLYGKYDKFDPINSHMIPAIIKKVHDAVMNNSDKVEIWGDGEARREFMYVDDLVDFIEMAIESYDNVPSTINVGLGVDYTVNEYYRTVSEVIGYKGSFYHDLTKPSGMQQKLVDVSLSGKFGWVARTTLEEGIRKTYDYYLSII